MTSPISQPPSRATSSELPVQTLTPWTSVLTAAMNVGMSIGEPTWREACQRPRPKMLAGTHSLAACRVQGELRVAVYMYTSVYMYMFYMYTYLYLYIYVYMYTCRVQSELGVALRPRVSKERQ